MTASPSIAAKWLVLRLHRFQEQHPEIDVRISATDEVVDLTRGDFDIAIRYGRGIYPGLDVELLFTNEVFPACSPQLLTAGPPLRTPDDLPRHTLIHDQAVGARSAGADLADVAEGRRSEERSGDRRASPSTACHLALDAAIAGQGVVLAYSTIAAADLAAGRLVRLFSLALPDQFAYYIVTAPGALERPKVRAFRNWLRQEADR